MQKQNHHLKPYQPPKRSQLVGREAEVRRLKLVAQSGGQIVVVHGRRRVGKTFLIEKVFEDRNLVKFEGIEGKPRDYQIRSCFEQLHAYGYPVSVQAVTKCTWRSFLRELADATAQGLWTIYLEELQWLAAYDTELIAELKYFWDNDFSKNQQIVLVLCGSAPSFMVNDVINSKALYNRSHIEVALQPFTLAETRSFLGDRYTTNDLFDAYLSVGGIPV